MNVLIISYSLTGNNEKLAIGSASALSAEHIRIREPRKRTIGKIILDMVFNLNPKIQIPAINPADYDLIIFIGPVWLGQVAFPLRTCFQQLRSGIGKYAFISLSGGADGSNPKLAEELKKRLGKEPMILLDFHIAELLPSEPKPTRKDTSAYQINERDIEYLTGRILSALKDHNPD